MPPRASPNKGTPWIDHHTVFIPNTVGDVDQTIRLGTPPWDAWLPTATKLYVKHTTGSFFCRREHGARGGYYWIAYRRHSGHVVKYYLGKDAMVTAQKLDEAAQQLAYRLIQRTATHLSVRDTHDA